MLFEVVLQHEPDHGRALAVACYDERTAPVAVLKVPVERACYVFVRYPGDRSIDVPCLFYCLAREAKAGLAVERHEYVC